MRFKTFIFVFLLLTTSGCILFRPSPEALYTRALKEQPFDVIIVPGIPFDGKEWSEIMRGRVVWAVYLLKQGIAKNVIFSGGAVYTPYVEARIMALYAEKLGVPKSKISLEEKARHSTENIFYSYWIAKEKGYTKIAVATDMFQSRLLMGFTKRKFKSEITHIPFMIDTLRIIDNINPTIEPSSAMVKNFKSIVDTESKWQRFRGTQGKNIHFIKSKQGL